MKISVDSCIRLTAAVADESIFIIVLFLLELSRNALFCKGFVKCVF